MIQTNDSMPEEAGAAAPRAARFTYAKPQTPMAALPIEAQVPNYWWVGLLAILGLIVWFYLHDFALMSKLWIEDASWSHGFLIPVFAGFFVYLQWETLKRLPLKGTTWGLPLMLFGIASHVLFLTTGQLHMSDMSLLVVCFGLVLFLLGVDYLKVLWMPVGFLVFMIPVPYTLYVKLTTPMQYLAAELGVRLMPLFGITAERLATQVKIFTGRMGMAQDGWESLEVAEACSGMRLLMAFVALAVALAYTTSRPMWQKVFLAVSSVPIAIFCNALRVTLIGILFARVSPEYAHGSTHIYIGMLMLAPAMGMQLGLAWILDRLFIETPTVPSGEAAR